MKRPKECRIVSVGKRRDGGTRYWCLEHRADATAKYGRRARRCRYAHIRPPAPSEILRLNVSKYLGGVALWGAVPPIYDTTRLPLDRGIHVHARCIGNGNKKIDKTYRAVSLVGTTLPQEGLAISELDAIYYMVASVFGYTTKYIECPLCDFPHLDKDWFSVHAHQHHLCAGCGKHFRDSERAIGNPVARIRDIFQGATHQPKPAKKSLKSKQSDYPGGIQIWGSNPAIVWTADRDEEEGIHVHAFSRDATRILLDDTFSRVTLDGIDLDPTMVRIFMAQNALPHIAGRITNTKCPECKEPHFDTGEQAFTPHDLHICVNCSFEFKSQGRTRKTIGNPMVDLVARLAQNAQRTPQEHKTELIPETI